MWASAPTKDVQTRPLRPQSNATRAEVATILMRFCKLLNK